MNRNRILGITVLLAVVVLGLAFMSCPADTEDRVLTFINQTSVKISIVTDGSPASFDLDPAPSEFTETSRVVTKTGSDITITSLKFATINDGDWDRYLELDISAMPSQKKVKNGLALGSGNIVFIPRSTDPTNDGHVYDKNENPAARW